MAFLASFCVSEPLVSTTPSEHIACLVCGGSTAPWIVVPCDWRRPDRQQEYHLRRCRNCGFGQVYPRPGKHEIAGFYEVESYYTHGDRAALPGGEPRSLLDRLRIKLAWHNDQGVDLDESWFRERFSSRANVCDLGCGSGDLLATLARLGHDVTGVEPDPKAREVAIEKALRVFAGTAEELPAEIENERYDCVVMSHVLEHTLDPGRAIGNAIRLLAEHGILVIETPNNQAKGLQRSGALWPWLDVPRHLNFFTSESLRAICEAHELRVRDLQYRGYTRQFDPDWIRTEERIRDIFAAKVGHMDGLPEANRAASCWYLLFSSVWSPARLKYDSVRVIAERPSRNSLGHVESIPRDTKGTHIA